jgi:3-hydroxybutyryl-CoA dehydratase
MTLQLTELHLGLELPGLQKQVIQEEINLYAKASHDFNPIHIDPEFARNTPAGGTIAHGMLVLAYVSRMMTDSFGKNWLDGGRFNIRFKAPARPGDILSIQGKVVKIQQLDQIAVINCEVLCANQKGEAVITGEAIVRIKNDKNSS